MTDSSSPTTTQLPPVAPHVVAAAVAGLTSRLRKKLDAATEQYAAAPTEAGAEGVRITCGADTVVTLMPGPSGVITNGDEARCSCLLSPRCLHRAAVLSACPIADESEVPPAEPAADGEAVGATDPSQTAPDATTPAAGTPEASTPAKPGPAAAVATRVKLTRAQRAAAAALWDAASAVLAAGVPAVGAVMQAELLRATHAAKLAGLHRAEAAALRVVRGLRAARARSDNHRLADLVYGLHELLLTAGLLTAPEPTSDLVGTARRAYKVGGSLRVYGVCREPVISATGYGGVVTHLVSDDGRWHSIADVKPGGSARARGAGTAAVALGAAAVSHAQLARGGLLITGTTISPDGRLGAGKSVRATPFTGISWSAEPLAALFARPLARAVAERLAAEADPSSRGTNHGLVGCDLVVLGASGEHLLARELNPAAAPGPVIRLAPANPHPDLAHTTNLRRLASRPGLHIRVVGRLDLNRAVTLRPLAVRPVSGVEPTLRLPEPWQGHADLGYDQLQGSHLPPAGACTADPAVLRSAPDPLADSPLWQARRLVELAVAGGRRAVAESARSGDGRRQSASLRGAGFHTAAGLATELTAEADRRDRDVFGRLTDSGNDRYAWSWLAATTHLAATERSLVQASWQATP